MPPPFCFSLPEKMVRLQKGLSGAMNAKIIGAGATTLVLAHGYGANQSVWDKVVPELSLRYRVVVFDWCFAGGAVDEHRFSYEAFADDLIALADEMNLRDAVFLGHSMAGMIGCIASIKRPEIFKNLMLLGASPRYLNSEDYKGGFDIAGVENIFTNIESNFQQWSRTFAALVVGNAMHDPTSVEKFGTMLRSMRPGVALSLAKTVFLSDQRKTLEKVEVPCTIIQCSNDIVVPMPVVHHMKNTIKGKTRLEIIEADGHFPQLTAPKMFMEITDRVLASSEPEPAIEIVNGVMDSGQAALEV